MTQLRADAQHNRDKILAAARLLFAQRGLDVGMREIARQAGVGPATLYRRFPTRQDVIDEAFAAELRACRQAVVRACAEEDAWAGFTSAVRELLALNAASRGFTDAFTAATPSPGPIAVHRRELLAMLGGLARRAQRSGQLRSDFTVDDLVLILRAGRALPAGRAGAPHAQVQRFATLAIDAFSAGRGPRQARR